MLDVGAEEAVGVGAREGHVRVEGPEAIVGVMVGLQQGFDVSAQGRVGDLGKPSTPVLGLQLDEFVEEVSDTGGTFGRGRHSHLPRFRVRSGLR